MTIITFGGGRGVTTEPKVSFIIIYLTLMFKLSISFFPTLRLAALSIFKSAFSVLIKSCIFLVE